MGFTLELRGHTVGSWPLTGNCLQQVEKLSKGASRPAIELLFGDSETQDGTLRTVSRVDLLPAVALIESAARTIPAGFQMRIPPIVPGMKSSVGSGGFSGLLIEGKYYAIDCRGDHCTLTELREGLPEPAPRYDAAEISTENFGIIKVWPRKSGNSELSKLARRIHKFLENDSSEEIQIVWG